MNAQSDPAPGLADFQEEKQPQSPIYLDSEGGFRRLEETDLRNFRTLGMYFLSQETQTF